MGEDEKPAAEPAEPAAEPAQTLQVEWQQKSASETETRDTVERQEDKEPDK